MNSIKSLTTLFLAATFVGLAGCGQSDNRGQTDDSGMSDTAPSTTGDTAGSASDPYATSPGQTDPYATSPGQTDDSMTAPQSAPQGDATGSSTYPTDPGTSDDMSTSPEGSATEPSTPPAQ